MSNMYYFLENYFISIMKINNIIRPFSNKIKGIPNEIKIHLCPSIYWVIMVSAACLIQVVLALIAYFFIRVMCGKYIDISTIDSIEFIVISIFMILPWWICHCLYKKQFAGTFEMAIKTNILNNFIVKRFIIEMWYIFYNQNIKPNDDRWLCHKFEVVGKTQSYKIYDYNIVKYINAIAYFILLCIILLLSKLDGPSILSVTYIYDCIRYLFINQMDTELDSPSIFGSICDGIMWACIDISLNKIKQIASKK